MNIPNKNQLHRTMKALLVLALLVIIINPELRILVMFVDFVGIDLIFLLLVLQLRSTYNLLQPFAQMLRAGSCSVAAQLGWLALRAYQKALVLRRFDRLICPIPIIASYGLHCRVAIRAI